MTRPAPSLNNIAIAFGVALALHFMLLSLSVSLPKLALDSPREINVSIVQEQNEIEEPQLKESQPEQNPQVIEKAEEKPQTIITTEIEAEPKKTTSFSIQTSPASTEFQTFLKNETNSYTKENPQEMGGFEQSFNSTKPVITDTVPKTAEERVAQKTQLNRTGLGMSIEEKGQRTCHAVMPNPFNQSGPPTVLSNDCTPPKKFVLDLDKPINY